MPGVSQDTHLQPIEIEDSPELSSEIEGAAESIEDSVLGSGPSTQSFTFAVDGVDYLATYDGTIAEGGRGELGIEGGGSDAGGYPPPVFHDIEGDGDEL